MREGSDVDVFLSELRREGLSPASVNRSRSRLSSMMNRAIAWGYAHLADSSLIEAVERIQYANNNE